MSRLGALLHGGRVGVEDLGILMDKLYFDRGDRRDAYVRFAVLLGLSSVIAAGGVVADSTATVIGAMIIAPLMTPIMATALAIVTGDGPRLVRSVTIVLAGVAAAVAIGFLVGWLSSPVDVSSNSQVVGRSTPRLIDLAVALATGAVGAFALSRENVSDSLPGVAIAISLVPPLAVVGIALQAGAPEEAAGALLLFGTNVLAILTAGGGVLWLMGYHRAARARAEANEDRRVGALAVVAGLLVVVIPLGAHSANLSQTLDLRADAEALAREWAQGSSLELVEIRTDGGEVEVLMAGLEAPPDVEDLAGRIREEHPDVEVVVRVIGAARFEASKP